MAKKINLRALRQRLGLSQQELAERLGVNQTTVHRWENNERRMSGPAQKLIEQMEAQVSG